MMENHKGHSCITSPICLQLSLIPVTLPSTHWVQICQSNVFCIAERCCTSGKRVLSCSKYKQVTTACNHM